MNKNRKSLVAALERLVFVFCCTVAVIAFETDLKHFLSFCRWRIGETWAISTRYLPLSPPLPPFWSVFPSSGLSRGILKGLCGDVTSDRFQQIPLWRNKPQQTRFSRLKVHFLFFRELDFWCHSQKTELYGASYYGERLSGRMSVCIIVASGLPRSPSKLSLHLRGCCLFCWAGARFHRG